MKVMNRSAKRMRTGRERRRTKADTVYTVQLWMVGEAISMGGKDRKENKDEIRVGKLWMLRVVQLRMTKTHRKIGNDGGNGTKGDLDRNEEKGDRSVR
jgi:hypothetical protein